MHRRFIFNSKPIAYRLLATGQATAYGSGAGVDDGALKKGIAKSYTLFATGQFTGTTNVAINSKTDAHSNNVALDNNTGLMWSSTGSASVGPTSNGLLPWTTTGSGGTAEGIFPYVLAANTALLSGYGDWRVPNIYELLSIADYEAATSAPDATAFPSWSVVNVFWCASTVVSATTNAYTVAFATGLVASAVKTATGLCALVRG